MKSVVLMLSSLCLTLAAPVDEHHQREARDASEEDLRLLLTEVKDTLANINSQPVAPEPAEVAPQVHQDVPQAKPTIVLTPLHPITPSVDSTAAQSAAPRINLFISTQPQQGGAVAAPPLTQPQLQAPFPGQEVMTAGPAAQLGPFLPQRGVTFPVTFPNQRVQVMDFVPNQDVQLQNSPLAHYNPYMVQYPYVNPYMNPYVNSYVNPYFNMYSPYNMYRNYGLPSIAVTPPIIFRERGPAVANPV